MSLFIYIYEKAFTYMKHYPSLYRIYSKVEHTGCGYEEEKEINNE